MDGRRSIWIGGASRGIGAALAAAMAELGHEVRGFSRGTGYDLAVPGTLDRALAEGPAPWAWIHAMGDFVERPLDETTDADWEALLDSNLRSFVRSTRVLCPAMRAAGGGRVLAFGAAGQSQATGKRRAPAYFAVKQALLSVVRSLAVAEAAHGITVNLLSPGVIVHPHSHRQSQDRIVARIPAGRAGTPGDLTGLVTLLLSDGGAYLTGQELVVDGGLSLRID